MKRPMRERQPGHHTTPAFHARAGTSAANSCALAPDEEQASRVTPPSLLQFAQGGTRAPAGRTAGRRREERPVAAGPRCRSPMLRCLSSRLDACRPPGGERPASGSGGCGYPPPPSRLSGSRRNRGRPCPSRRWPPRRVDRYMNCPRSWPRPTGIAGQFEIRARGRSPARGGVEEAAALAGPGAEQAQAVP